MTDRETLIQMLQRAKIVARLKEEQSPEQQRYMTERAIDVHADDNNGMGYMGFVTAFSFNEDGSLSSVAAWE